MSIHNVPYNVTNLSFFGGGNVTTVFFFVEIIMLFVTYIVTALPGYVFTGISSAGALLCKTISNDSDRP